MRKKRRRIRPTKDWLREPTVIAAIIGVIGAVIAGIITGGFGLLGAMIGVREPIKATQAREATLTALALAQNFYPPPETLTPTGFATPEGTATRTFTLIPTHTASPSPTLTPTRTNTPTETPTHSPTPTPTEPSIQELYPIAISEVMGNPCGESEKIDAAYNEYVELFNYGDRAVNVEGLWISDGSDKQGNPDEIIPWSRRETDFNLGNHLITSEAVIPPDGYAVILSPGYIAGRGVFRLPYLFPRNTVILTIADGKLLGDDKSGIEVQLERDPIILYTGNQDIVEEVISTYGTPRLSGSPQNLRDDGEDGIPFHLQDCYSAERIDPRYADRQEYWTEVKDGTPGSGPGNPSG
jgi:hypothetical protein